jgi:flagellar motor switch protein FliG
VASTAIAKRKKSGSEIAEELTGRQKVAVLLMALGEEASASVTRKLAPDEVEAVSFEIAKMRDVDPEVVRAVIEEWHHTESAATSLAQGGVDFARRVLEKAFGPQKASVVLKRIESQLHDHASLTHLRNADPQQLTAMIRNEHPQLIALVLAYLEPAQTAAVLQEIDGRLRGDVILRIARMEKVLPEVLQILESSLGADSDLSLSKDGAAAGGPFAVAEVLNLIPSGIEKELLDDLSSRDGDLAEEIKGLMFVFEDIIKLDDRGIARLLRDVETKELALSLKVASEELKERILDTMSARARDALIEEMDFLGPVRVTDVETAQSSVVKMARLLEEAGEIVIGGADELLVE